MSDFGKWASWDAEMCRADANSASLGCCVILAINDDFHVTDALDLMLINVEFRGGARLETLKVPGLLTYW